MEGGSQVDGGSKSAAIDVTSIFDVGYLLRFDLKNDKILSIVRGIVDVGSRNGVDGDDASKSGIIGRTWDWGTTVDIDRSDRSIKAEVEHVVVLDAVSWSKG